MIASLMMYARPEMEASLQRYWALICEGLLARGLDAPEALANDAPAFSVWEAPDLLISQTCGLPYRTRLHGKVRLVGTPDYGLDGCPPGHYNSALVVRADDPRERVEDFKDARFVLNEAVSQSGYGAAYNFCMPKGFWFADRVQSGAHAISARMVAEGQADIASLDALTWRLIQRYDDHAARLRVLDWTPPTPGTPYITAATRDPAPIAAAVRDAIASLADADRKVLCLRGLADVSDAAYMAVPNPPAAPVQAG